MLMELYLPRYARLFAKTDRNLWNYEDGCVLIGLMALYEAAGDPLYFDCMRTFMDRYIDEQGCIRLYDLSAYNLDFIPSGRILFPLYAATGDERYRKAAEQLMDQLRQQPRTQAGSFWHKGIYPNQVWLDGLYMGLPFYALYQRHFGDGNMEDILLQFRNIRRFLFDPAIKLYYHAYCETRDIFWADPDTGCSRNFWTRSLGWLMMAFADVYESLSEPGQRQELAVQWRECMDGLLAVRDPESGMFLQLPTIRDKDNYPETSGSLMIAYSLLKGARLGVWPDDTYGSAGLGILLAIESTQFHLRDNVLHLGGICKGAGLGPAGNFRRDGSVAYYLSEPVVEDEQKGVGVCMMAYAEYLRAQSGTLSGPAVSIYTQGYDPILPEEIREQNFVHESRLTSK